MTRSLLRAQGVYLCLLSLQKELEDEDQWTPKERVWQRYDSKRNPLKLKLYPPLRNATKGVYLANGGNILKYKVKTNPFLKPRSNLLLIRLALQLVQKFEHKRKKEKNLPLDIHNEFQEDFVLVHKIHLMEHGGQAIKQVSKLEMIFEHTTSPKPITQK